MIETKNYSGDIYGKDKQLEWTQVLAYGNAKNKLYNPLRQNRTHIYRLRKIIGNVPIKSLVVFTGDCTLNVNSPDVIKLWQLRSKLSYGEEVLSEFKMKQIYTKLVNNKSEISATEHIINVKKQKRDIDNFLCPRCGKPLVLKNGKYGEFFGCSGYPKCKFIKKQIKDEI